MLGRPRDMISAAEHRFPVRIRLAVPSSPPTLCCGRQAIGRAPATCLGRRRRAR